MCLFLSSPDRLPANPYCILLSLFAYMLLGLFLVEPERTYLTISAEILLELAMLGMITYLGLRMKKTLPRFQQTLSALIGINLIITAVSLPAYHYAVSFAADSGRAVSLLFSVRLLIAIWYLAVLSLIFKRAFAISTQLSAVISFVFFFNYLIVAVWMFQ